MKPSDADNILLIRSVRFSIKNAWFTSKIGQLIFINPSTPEPLTKKFCNFWSGF